MQVTCGHVQLQKQWRDRLAYEAVLTFGQDVTGFQKDYDAVGPLKRRQMWRQRREVGKLHNLVTHVMASRKRTDLFTELQKECNTRITKGKLWRLVLDRGIRWNSTYSMIRRALELREALDTYAAKLHMSKEAFDQETF